MRCCCKKKNKDKGTAEEEEDDEEEEEECEGEDSDSDYCCHKRTYDVNAPWASHSYPGYRGVKSPSNDYVRNLECEFECLQKAFLSLTTHFARLQFRLRQIMQAAPEERYGLLCDLERLAFEGIKEETNLDELPRIQRDIRCMGDIRRKVNTCIDKLRGQLEELSEASDFLCIDDDESEKKKNRRRSNDRGENSHNGNGKSTDDERSLSQRGSKRQSQNDIKSATSSGHHSLGKKGSTKSNDMKKKASKRSVKSA